MKDFEAAKELFKDSIDPSFYFDSISAEIARTKLIETIGDMNTPLIFIAGDPGVGKSHMIRVMHQTTALRAVSIFIEHPFFTSNDLLRSLYEAKNLIFDQAKSQAESLEELFEAYVGSPCTVFIDEAQLLNDDQFEFIRVLGDLKLFQFILAMHKHEGRVLLQKKQFKTRNKLVIEYGNLSENEVLRYIQTLLMSHMHGEIALMFSKRDIKKIVRYTHGNFSTIKKFLYLLMKILGYAQENNLTKYRKLSRCLLMMTALDAELIHDS